jgi:hypothetical protein
MPYKCHDMGIYKVCENKKKRVISMASLDVIIPRFLQIFSTLFLILFHKRKFLSKIILFYHTDFISLIKRPLPRSQYEKSLLFR